MQSSSEQPLVREERYVMTLITAVKETMMVALFLWKIHSYLFRGLLRSSGWHWLICISVCLSLSFKRLIVSLSLRSSRINATCLSCKQMKG